MLQNGKLPRFLEECHLDEIFENKNPSPCMLALRSGLDELGIYQVCFYIIHEQAHLLRVICASFLVMEQQFLLAPLRFTPLPTSYLAITLTQ